MVETVEEVYENQRYFGPLGWYSDFPVAVSTICAKSITKALFSTGRIVYESKMADFRAYY